MQPVHFPFTLWVPWSQKALMSPRGVQTLSRHPSLAIRGVPWMEFTQLADSVSHHSPPHPLQARQLHLRPGVGFPLLHLSSHSSFLECPPVPYPDPLVPCPSSPTCLSAPAPTRLALALLCVTVFATSESWREACSHDGRIPAPLPSSCCHTAGLSKQSTNSRTRTMSVCLLLKTHNFIDDRKIKSQMYKHKSTQRTKDYLSYKESVQFCSWSILKIS